jgi:hypothetical protein
MLSQEEVLRLIGIAIGDPNFNIDSTTENTKNWDSLGLLSMLETLTKLTSGKSDKIPEILNVSTASDLVRILRENNLIT